jgi:uncharacterized protein YdaU (DUF1376 family)
MKDPAFLFYPNDYLGGTMGFTLEQHGAYLILLIYQFNNGPFSAANGRSIVGESLFNSITHKFDCDDNGLLHNARLSQEIDKRRKHSEHQRENANKRWNRKATAMHPQCDGIAGAMPLENENENTLNSSSSDLRERGMGGEVNSEHRSCSELLSTRIKERRQQKIDEVTLRRWDNDVRLMVERDGRTVEQIRDLINECHDMEPQGPSGFTWRNNILSMSTLRQRWNEGKIYVGMLKDRGLSIQGERKVNPWEV